MLQIGMDYLKKCGCYPGCNSLQYTPVLAEENPKETENLNLLNIERWAQNKGLDTDEIPGH